jgi:ribosomal protein S18 acetylase RimI-like enzyme/predicted nucleic acid-binding protein
VSYGQQPVYRAERDPTVLVQHLSAIRTLADAEKEALGFLPEAAYRDAVEKRRLVAMCTAHTDSPEVVGFILYSGVFPHARIQQIVVAPGHRRARVASALINEIISRLEAQGYLTITAAVASDLDHAQAFYERNGFVARRTLPGGSARKRLIILRCRDLDTRSLFSILEPAPAASANAVDLGLRARSAKTAPLYAIDLNVMFDAIRTRPRTDVAERVIAGALAHEFRLAIAPEFIAELERHTTGRPVDPVLRLAQQLPRLPAVDTAAVDRLADVIHEIVFVAPRAAGAGSPQARSDARHLAQAALSRASGYITSDTTVLAARERLLENIGIDVASLHEFADLLAPRASSSVSDQVKGTAYTARSASYGPVRSYLMAQGLPDALIPDFLPSTPTERTRWRARAIFESDEIIGVAVSIAPPSIEAATRTLVHVRPDLVASEFFAEHLVHIECEEACRSGPLVIDLALVPGQGIVQRAAILRGFLRGPSGTLVKVALGRPLTSKTWEAIARQTRRRTGLRLPGRRPDNASFEAGITIQGPDGTPQTVRPLALEDALSPTLLVWPNHDGVIVPISRNYADDLLGTTQQLPLFGSPEAAFVTRRTYFSSPRTASIMRPATPILFYESVRSGGRGAIVAAARISDAVIMQKDQVSDEEFRRAVVEDLDSLTGGSETLVTSFDNILRFPSPVSLDTLRQLGAQGRVNFQTATAVASESFDTILELGWPRARRD